MSYTRLLAMSAAGRCVWMSTMGTAAATPWNNHRDGSGRKEHIVVKKPVRHALGSNGDHVESAVDDELGPREEFARVAGQEQGDPDEILRPSESACRRVGQYAISPLIAQQRPVLLRAGKSRGRRHCSGSPAVPTRGQGSLSGCGWRPWSSST